MRSDHDEVKGFCIEPIGQKILKGLDFEFVNEDAAKVTFLLGTDGGIIHDFMDFCI